MTTISWMLSRMVLTRFVAVLFGISIFVITLNVLLQVDEILRVREGRLMGLVEYALLLVPPTTSTFLGVSALLAILLTLIELIYRNELQAIWATGVSPLRIAVMLLPVGIALGGINFLINDQAVPRVSPVLHQWGIGDYSRKKLNTSNTGPIWLRSGSDILRAGSANSAATELSDVMIFRRDRKGLLLEQILAKKAILHDGRWELSDVLVYYRQNLEPSRIARLIYSGTMRPATKGVRSGDPEEMTLADLGHFIRNAGYGIRPPYVYETWWHRRVSLLLTAWMMIAMCIPLAVRFERGGGAGKMFLFGLTLGFAFSIFEGVALTMGEVGVVPPWAAAWIPLIAFGSIAAAVGFRAETIS